MHIIVRMDYEWDPKKSTANLRKHGIRFADLGRCLHLARGTRSYYFSTPGNL